MCHPMRAGVYPRLLIGRRRSTRIANVLSVKSIDRRDETKTKKKEILRWLNAFERQRHVIELVLI